MIKIRLIFAILFTSASSALCQVAEPINTDRPDQSDGTFTLPKNSFQLETGFTYGKDRTEYLLHNTMLRYGLFSETEIRLLVDYGKVGSETGLMPIGISVKQGIITQKGWIPAISAVGYINAPFLSTSNFEPNKVPMALLLAFENEISEKFSVGYNFGSTLDGESSKINWVFTTGLGYSVKTLSFFAEYFSQFASSMSPDHNIDVGAAWLLNDDLQLDIALGSTIFKKNKNQFITSGVSYRF